MNIDKTKGHAGETIIGMENDQIKKKAAEIIIEAVKFSVVSGMMARDIGVECSASLQRNIRDAMFHYRKLCIYADQANDEYVLKHYYNLKEHIIRGEKDAIILQAGNVLDALYELQQRKYFLEFTPWEVKELQLHSHKIREVILDIRTDGIDPDSQQGFPLSTFSELKKYIRCIMEICENRNIPLF